MLQANEAHRHNLGIGRGKPHDVMRRAYDAGILVVDGNPLDDLNALHHIHAVQVRGTAPTNQAADRHPPVLDRS